MLLKDKNAISTGPEDTSDVQLLMPLRATGRMSSLSDGPCQSSKPWLSVALTRWMPKYG